jgi:hypothetical protein
LILPRVAGFLGLWFFEEETDVSSAKVDGQLEDFGDGKEEGK